MVANFGVNYVIAIDTNADRFTVLNRANIAIAKNLNNNQYDIGETIMITDFYKILQKVPGIIDVIDLEIVGKAGGIYSDLSYDFVDKLSADGRRVMSEKNTIFELKFPNIDIKGSIT